MTIYAATGLDPVATNAFAHLFQALGDGSRLAVLQHLASGEHRVRDLVEHLGLAQSTVSAHVSFLAECGLVEARVEGRSTWYALARPAPLAALILAAEQLLESTGSRHSLCVHLTAGAGHPSGTTIEEGADGRRA
ncbi:hypothetical protein L332_06160 [Agrococcus pavilionensis RW1]|uniref:HTH arsR-type domain-containing protein n=1 Tax=Agrococcus pavilionensis RW1 TaxID=1330458 RepID=U1MQ25_9MICO|nr:metalloregulator ArsR/SmtB family transcription factor [Agrococcus pavilionensis]ERG64041.1 hypothetical protein L332_06160 [Agrococcus pavilionensis RW1]